MAQKWGRGGHGYQEYDESNGEYGEDKEGTTYSRDKGDKPEKAIGETGKSYVEIDTETGKPVGATSLFHYADVLQLQGVNQEGQDIILKALNELAAEYPINKLTVIKSSSMRRGLAMACGGALTVQKAYFNGEIQSSRFRLYQSVYEAELQGLKDKEAKGLTTSADERRIKKLEHDLKFDRWSVSGSDRKATIYHEYGHILADQKFGQINGGRYCSEPYEERRNKQLLVEQTFDKARASGDIFKISQYADSNPHEFYAECFAARQSGEKLPDYIEEMFRRTL